MSIIQHVDIEYCTGTDGWRERKSYTDVDDFRYAENHSIYLHSRSKGTLYLNLAECRLIWFCTEPASLYTNKPDADQQIIATYGGENRNFIAAIKVCRELYGYGLKEAKTYVENLCNHFPARS